MISISHAGSARVLVPFNIAVFLMLVLRHRRPAAMFWALAVVGAALLNFLAKQLFARVRPDLWVSILPETTFSFPSGHTMQSTAVAVALTILMWRTRARWATFLAGTCFAVLVGLSRVYLGVHYPSDILAGWCASLVWVIGTSLPFSGRLHDSRADLSPSS